MFLIEFLTLLCSKSSHFNLGNVELGLLYCCYYFSYVRVGIGLYHCECALPLVLKVAAGVHVSVVYYF